VVLERLSGINATELLSAAYHPQSQRSNQLRSAIDVIERARRRILLKLRRSPYGTH
jgi:precorrin-3B methylase